MQLKNKKTTLILLILTSYLYAFSQTPDDREVVYLEFKPNLSEKYKINTICNYTTFYIDGVRFVNDNRISPDTIDCRSLKKLTFRKPPYLEDKRRDLIKKNTIFMVKSPFKQIFIILKEQNHCLRYMVEWEPDWVQE